ncbi:MAG: tetratricopeptide repeat protein [Woeseia sp.]
MTPASRSRAVREVVESVLALAQADRLDEAETLCRNHLAASADDVNLVAMLGALLIRRCHYTEAQNYLERAIELEPKFAKPHEDLAALYLTTGRPSEAIARFQTAIALDPRQASAYYGLATALERSGRGKEAEVARNRFLALSPGGKALEEAARLRLAGHIDRAEAICGEILSKESRNVSALRLLAKICADSQRDAAAEGLLRRIMSIAPDYLLAYKDLAWLFLERSRFPEAVAMLEKAVALRPDAADLHQALADTLAIVGRSADALAAYDGVLGLQPDSPRALLGRGHMSRIRAAGGVHCSLPTLCDGSAGCR